MANNGPFQMILGVFWEFPLHGGVIIIIRTRSDSPEKLCNKLLHVFFQALNHAITIVTHFVRYCKNLIGTRGIQHSVKILAIWATLQFMMSTLYLLRFSVGYRGSETSLHVLPSLYITLSCTAFLHGGGGIENLCIVSFEFP